MLQRYKFQDLRTQIIEIQDRYPNLSPDEAFVVWYLRSYLVDSEDKAIEALRGAPHDKGVDAALAMNAILANLQVVFILHTLAYA
jgi:hypothetical protein